MNSREVLVFEVGNFDFVLPLSLVEEVLPVSTITKIPNSPPFFLGLSAVRGRIMGVIDASIRYGIGPTLNSYLMICKVRGNLTAITIDRPLLAGELPLRLLSEQELMGEWIKTKIDKKFLKAGYELLEQMEDGSTVPTGKFLFEIDPDLFVSEEMAIKVGEV